MGIITSLITGAPLLASTPPPDADFWYQPVGGVSQAGIGVTDDIALRVSAFYRGSALLCDALASLPLILYRQNDDGGKSRAKDQPLYSRLRRRPNAWQTSFEWKRQAVWHVIFRGNFYNRIVPGPSGFADQLVPMHPDRVTPKQLPTGRIVYQIRSTAGRPPETLTQDEVFHVRGRSFDGVTGVSILTHAVETLGTAAAQNVHTARFYRQGAEVPLALKHPSNLGPEKRAELRAAWQETHGGAFNAHKLAILEGGLDLVKIGMTGRDAQTIETMKFSVVEIARFLGVQPHKLFDLDRATFSNIEQQALEFWTDTLMPFAVNIEEAVSRDLILDPEQYVAEFLPEALLRGDTLARAQAYALFIANGVMSENEARKRENLNPWPGLDRPERSANQGRASAVPAGTDARPFRPVDDEGDDDGDSSDVGARARAVVQAVAARLVAREIAFVRRAASEHAGEPARWRAAVTRWYDSNGTHLVDMLGIDQAVAHAYCAEHEGALLVGGVAVMERWEQDAPVALAALALGEG